MEPKDLSHKIAQSARLQAISAALPHVGAAHHKKLAVLIKLLEIKEICRHCDTLAPQDAHTSVRRRQMMIDAIMPHVSEAKQQNLKTLMQFMEMQEVVENFEKFKELTEWTQTP